MSFLLFLRGFVIALIAFAVANYAITQSLRTTLVNTAICAVLIQIGYFAAVLFPVWRAGAHGERDDSASRGEANAPLAKEGKSEAAPVPGVRRSPLP